MKIQCKKDFIFIATNVGKLLWYVSNALTCAGVLYFIAMIFFAYPNIMLFVCIVLFFVFLTALFFCWLDELKDEDFFNRVKELRNKLNNETGEEK